MDTIVEEIEAHHHFCKLKELKRTIPRQTWKKTAMAVARDVDIESGRRDQRTN